MTGSRSVPAPARVRLPSFGVQVAVGMAAGLALGMLARALGPDASALGETLRTAGQVFVQLLKALVPPLVFTAIVASVAALRDLPNAARLVSRTLLWFAATALIAVIIGIALALIVQPGLRAGVDPAAAVAPSTTGSWLDFLKGIVPANLFGLSATTTIKDGVATTAIGFNVLQIIVAAVVIGVAAVKAGGRARRSSPSTPRRSRYSARCCAG